MCRVSQAKIAFMTNLFLSARIKAREKLRSQSVPGKKCDKMKSNNDDIIYTKKKKKKRKKIK